MLHDMQPGQDIKSICWLQQSKVKKEQL